MEARRCMASDRLLATRAPDALPSLMRPRVLPNRDASRDSLSARLRRAVGLRLSGEESGERCRVFNWLHLSIYMHDAIAEVTALRLLSRQAGPGAAMRGRGRGLGPARDRADPSAVGAAFTNRFYEAKRADSSRV